MRNIINTLLFLLINFHAAANMANPVVEGTLGARPFVSQFVDVVHEDLVITIDSVFEKVTFNIIYHVSSEADGKQIPFLFYASEYFDLFTVKVDGKEIYIQDVPNNLKAPENSKFSDFSYFFENSENPTRSSVEISDSPSSGFTVGLSNMKYFEADISAGDHVIEVTYKATKWIDSWDWVKKFSFRYALSPAKYWKSFGTLNIVLDATKYNKALSSNIGAPSSGKIDSIAEWNFGKIPVDILHISYIPEISQTAQNLIKIGTGGLAVIAGILIIITHIFLVIWYRNRHPKKKYSLAVILGSFFFPLLFFICWIYSDDLIRSYIGEFVGKNYSYNFLVILFYPFVLPLYWLVFWLLDTWYKERIGLKLL